MRLFLTIGITLAIVALVVMSPRYTEVHHVYLPSVSRDTNFYYGVFVYGWERSSLAHCHPDEWSWWVWGGPAYGELQNRYYEVAGEDYVPVYIEVSGQLSEKGSWGFMGHYSRQLQVTEVITVAAEPIDMKVICDHPAGQ